MSQWWRGGLAALGVFALFWLFSVWQWQTQATDVQARDLWLQLLVAPLLVCLAGVMAWQLLHRVRAGAAGGAASGAAPVMAQAAAGASGDNTAAPAPAWPPLALCGHALSLPGALANMEAAEVAEALRKGQSRPALDPELTDLDGMPVYTARIDALVCADTPLDTEVAAAAIDRAGPEGASWPPAGRVARTQALLAALSWSIWSQVEEALQAWRWALPEGTSEEQPSAANAPTWLAGVARPPTEPQGPRTRLFLRVLVPQAWPMAWQQAAVAAVLTEAPVWLRAPAAEALFTLDAAAWPVHDAEGLWSHLADWRALQARRPSPESLWVVGADSLLDADHIDHLQAQGDLFTPHHQLGRIPAEGAAAVWLSTPEWQQALNRLLADACPPVSQALHQVLQARRERSADLHGRAHTGALLALLTEASSTPELLVTDADHRASRTAEVFEALTEWAPALDPMQQVLRLGDACGDLGLARGLACLALAAGLPGTATVALVHDPLRRTVLHLRSPSEPEVVQ